ncbi:MAG: hypothetical protein P9L92_00440 [Candidatus Electryonea clarkiae]|nr:hypothetical protein [Candidatus Electryonea clarkiae]MDP8285971.1 hypothetical protein [Candidatus Electryonea clarkiae]
MLKTFSILVFYVLFLFAISTVKSQVVVAEGVLLDAEFRPRFELDNRDFSSETGNDAYGSMRTRIGIKLENIIENTGLYMMIADSRMLGYSNPYLTGEPPGPNGFDNNLGVKKVFIEVNDILKDGSNLVIGKMSNDQGRGYIFGPGNWNLYGPRTYDGIKIGYSNQGFELHLWSFCGSRGDRHWYPDSTNPASVPNLTIDYKLDHTLNGMDLSVLANKINFLFFQELDQERIIDTTDFSRNTSLNRMTAAVNLKLKLKKLEPQG